MATAPKSILLPLPLIVLIVVCDSSSYHMPDGKIKNCCGPDCRSAPSTAEAHYDEKYFLWQNRLGSRKARQNWQKILKLPLNNSASVGDLGCGGGWILAKIQAKSKVCIEYSDFARKFVADNRPEISTFKFVEEIPDGSLDMIYTTDVLEHVECPIQELREAFKKLKVGGILQIGIKNEGVELHNFYKKGDIHQHLYTWNNANLGNMARVAGFRVLQVEPGRQASFSTLNSIKQGVIRNDFGGLKHTFVYYWLRAVKP